LHLNCAEEKRNSVSETQDTPTLSSWINQDADSRESLAKMNFATTPLSEKEAEEATTLLIQDHQTALEARYGSQWSAGVLKMGDLQMPFYYQHFGTAPSGGRSLFISLHGGGETSAEVNDQQYNNQKHL